MKFQFVRSASDVAAIRATGDSVLGIEIPASMTDLCASVAHSADGVCLSVHVPTGDRCVYPEGHYGVHGCGPETWTGRTSRGFGNIDPQHGGSMASGRCAALEVAHLFEGGLAHMAVDDCTMTGKHTDACSFRGVFLGPDHDFLRADVLVTPRIDLDAVAAMALIRMYASGDMDVQDMAFPGAVHSVPRDMLARLEAIDRADSFTAGAWPGPRPFPAAVSPWGECGMCGGYGHISEADIGMNHGPDSQCETCGGSGSSGGPTEIEALAAVNWVCGWATPMGGNRLTLEQAVQVVGDWLRYGEEKVQGSEGGFPGIESVGDWSPGRNLSAGLLRDARDAAEDTRQESIVAVSSCRVPMRAFWLASVHDTSGTLPGFEDALVSEISEGGGVPRMIFTDSQFDAAAPTVGAGLAYCVAPVSVVRTPEGRFSIAAFDDGRVDFTALKAELNALEPGWGGPARMCSSPMGRASALSAPTVLAAVGRHLTGPA